MLPSPGRATLQVMLEPESKHQPHCVVGASANALMNSLPAQSQSVVQLRYNTWRETTEDGAQPTASELCSCTNSMPRAYFAKSEAQCGKQAAADFSEVAANNTNFSVAVYFIVSDID